MGALLNMKFAWQRALGIATACEHAAQAGDAAPETRSGCPECVAAGDSWKALRYCPTCGHVGCCDSSKNRHATRHARAAGHPIVASLAPGEGWWWCVVDERIVRHS